MAYAGICTTSLSVSGFSVIWGFSGWVMGEDGNALDIDLVDYH
jgi:hypothetical protein